LVLGRGDLNDNIYSRNDISIDVYGLQEIRFDNNEIIDKRREAVIDAMFEQISGLEYNAFEATDLGTGFLEAADMIKVRDTQEKEYLVLILGASITITSGMTGTMEADEPSTSTTRYQYATDSEKRQSKTEIIVDKQNKKITLVSQEVTEHDEKIAQQEIDINSIKQSVSNTIDYKREAQGITEVYLENAGQANILQLEIRGNKTYNNYLFPSEDLYPSNDLYPNMEGSELI